MVALAHRLERRETIGRASTEARDSILALAPELEATLAGRDPGDVFLITLELPDGERRDLKTNSRADLARLLELAATRWHAIRIEVDDYGAVLRALRAALDAEAAERAQAEQALERELA